MGTETVFAVVVKVVCGGAPEESIITALIGTAVVLLPHKHEGELTELPLCITKLHLHNCGEEGDGVEGRGDDPKSPNRAVSDTVWFSYLHFFCEMLTADCFKNVPCMTMNK